jgi:hypothetical protein
VKTLTLSITQHGLQVVAVAVMAADADGGDAVPLFGMEAIRATMLYLEEITDDSLAGAVDVTRMMLGGKAFEALRAEHIARELDPHGAGHPMMPKGDKPC